MLDDLNILDTSTWPVWPDKVGDTFGCSSVKALCKRFGLNEMNHDIMDDFRDYTNCGGRRAFLKLKSLPDCVKKSPCSSAECERGFSAMNMIITQLIEYVVKSTIMLSQKLSHMLSQNILLTLLMATRPSRLLQFIFKELEI